MRRIRERSTSAASSSSGSKDKCTGRTITSRRSFAMLMGRHHATSTPGGASAYTGGMSVVTHIPGGQGADAADQLVLGIESSCDETGVALVALPPQGPARLLAHALHSQIDMH